MKKMMDLELHIFHSILSFTDFTLSRSAFDLKNHTIPMFLALINRNGERRHKREAMPPAFQTGGTAFHFYDHPVDSERHPSEM